jgi:hypothetical protein
VSLIIEQQERRGKKYFLGFSRRDSVALVLTRIARVPVELGNLR